MHPVARRCPRVYPPGACWAAADVVDKAAVETLAPPTEMGPSRSPSSVLTARVSTPISPPSSTWLRSTVPRSSRFRKRATLRPKSTSSVRRRRPSTTAVGDALSGHPPLARGRGEKPGRAVPTTPSPRPPPSKAGWVSSPKAPSSTPRGTTTQCPSSARPRDGTSAGALRPPGPSGLTGEVPPGGRPLAFIVPAYMGTQTATVRSSSATPLLPLRA